MPPSSTQYGYSCLSAVEDGHTPDEVRIFERVCEPIALQIRRLDKGDVKLIWWFVAAVNEGEPVEEHEKDEFDVEFYGYEEVLRKLTFLDDRTVVAKAIALVKATIEQ